MDNIVPTHTDNWICIYILSKNILVFAILRLEIAISL